MKKLIVSVLLILVLVIATSCDEKMSEKTKLSIQGKTFNIEFNKATREESTSPDELTITFNNDALDLYWVALFSNYGATNYQEGNVSITTSENTNSFVIEEKVAEGSTSSTSFTVTFNDNNKVLINGTIANNPIPETAQTTIVESTKSDNLNAFKGRTYFGPNGTGTAARLVFDETTVSYVLFTNTVFEGSVIYVGNLKSSSSGSYEQVTFSDNAISIPREGSGSCTLTYDSNKDTFIDEDKNILKRIK